MPNLLLIGCGKMGGAMLASFISSQLIETIYVVDHHKPSTPDSNIHYYQTVAELPQGLSFDIICLAIKPQNFASLSSQQLPQARIIMSVMTGIGTTHLQTLNEAAVIVRLMPNLPVSIGMGATAAFANERLNHADKTLTSALLANTGMVEWLENEDAFDNVTALSGSGPAYLFRLIEVMAEAGISCGLDADIAMRLARQTVTGAAQMVATMPEKSAADLRESVTSKGGTTQAALDVLNDADELQRLFTRALKAAAERSRELSS